MVKLGHIVSIVASPMSYDDMGNTIKIETPVSYINDNGVSVYRLPYRYPKRICRFFRRMRGFKELIYSVNPDVIFFHNPQSSDILYAAKYVKEKNKILIVDNHADYYNSARNAISRNIKHRIIWKYLIGRTINETKIYYGTVPLRVDFLKEMYNIPNEKCKLLVMGVDDDLAYEVIKNKQINNPRIRHEISNDEFVILTGGKINSYRYETISLMKEIAKCQQNIRLIVFGKPSKEIKEEFLDLCDNSRIIYVGWLNERQIYEYMTSADLVVFPGMHSVLWEQAVGMGIPCVFRKIKGFEHVDLGGNARFVSGNSSKEIYDTIVEIYENQNMYKEMKRVALEKGRNMFSYYNIAESCINDIMATL